MFSLSLEMSSFLRPFPFPLQEHATCQQGSQHQNSPGNHHPHGPKLSNQQGFQLHTGGILWIRC